MRAARLGDDIDDFCVKCKRVMNHSVVSILNNLPAKVRCRTCHSDHDFRNEQPPPPKVDPRKAALFNQVLGNVTGLPAAPVIEAPALEDKVAPAPEAKAAIAAADGNVSGASPTEKTAAAPPTGKTAAAPPTGKTAAAPVESKPKGRKKTKA
jgi:hypothetical protein